MILRQPDQSKNNKNSETLPGWMVFLLLIIYLRTIQPQPQQQVTQSLNRAIWAVTIILITLIIATLGGAENLSDILSALSIIP
jgi:hypothetical protein